MGRYYNPDLILLPETVKCQGIASRYICRFFKNNASLCKEAGVSLRSMITKYQQDTGVKLTEIYIQFLKGGQRKSCDFTYLIYICQWWGVNLETMLMEDFDAKAVYESLSVKPVKGKNH